MSEHDLTPERLDAILDGEVPATDDDARDMLALAAQLRAAVPGADDTLRARVRTMPEAHPPRVGTVRRLLRSGWRGRMVVAAPALSAVLAAVIAVGVLSNSPGDSSSSADDTARTGATALQGESAASSAPPSKPTTPEAGYDTATEPLAAAGTRVLPTDALTVEVPSTTLPDRVDDLRRLVTDAGGTVVLEVSPGIPSATVATLDLPTDRVATTLTAIATLGSVQQRGALPDRDPSDPAPVGGAAGPSRTTVQVVVVEAP